MNAFAENRANDLVRALASPNANEGMLQMRAFLEQRGYSLKFRRTVLASNSICRIILPICAMSLQNFARS